MNKKPLQLLGIMAIFMLFGHQVMAQDKSLIISLEDSLVHYAFVTMDSSDMDSARLFFKNPQEADYVLYLLKNGGEKMDSLILKRETAAYSKDVLYLPTSEYGDQDTLYLQFKNPDIEFVSEDGDLHKNSFIIPRPRIAIKGGSLVEDLSFIPPLSDSGKIGWPDYYSGFGNSKYRMALDMSQSFNSISLWKLTKDSCYISKKKLSPAYGRFLSVSVKGLSPQYDSITQAYKFSNLHQKDKEQFNLIAKSIGGFPATDGDRDSQEPRGGEAEADTLNRLKEDLLHYETYLSRYIIDQSVWLNDLNYINSKLEEHLGLKDFTATGLKALLEEKFTNSSLIEAIVLSYARIQVYSIHSVPPLQIEDADLLSYKLAFYKGGKVVDERTYDFLIGGGFKIDFSAGFAYSSLKNESYLIMDAENETDPPTGEVSQKQIVLDKEDPSIGAAVFAHFYPRTGVLLNPSATLGFMTNLDAVFSYLAGGSLIVGFKQRAIISAGVNIGRVDRLSPKYYGDEDDEIIFDADKLEGVSESQLTRKEWDLGWFISISYNF